MGELREFLVSLSLVPAMAFIVLALGRLEDWICKMLGVSI